jgi:hypothetical protein
VGGKHSKFSAETLLAATQNFFKKPFAAANNVIFAKKFSCEFQNAMSTRFGNPAFPPSDFADARKNLNGAAFIPDG